MMTSSNNFMKLIPICGCLIAAMMVGCGESATETQTSSEVATTKSGQQVQADRGPLSATVVVAPEDPKLSDILTVTLTVTAPDNIQLKLPEFQSAFPDLVVRDFRDPLPQVSSGQKTWVQEYELEPMVAGKLTIPSFSIAYRSEEESAAADESDAYSGELVTEEFSVTVTTVVDSDSLSLDALKPPAEPLVLPAPDEPFPLLRWLVGAASLLVGAIVWWIRRKKRSVESQPSASEVAASELDGLLADQTAREDVSSFYVRLTGIVRRYIEAVTGVNAAEQTTEEFLLEMQERRLFSNSSKQRLQEFLEASDLIKFAGQTPDSESMEDSIRAARQFIQLPPGDIQNDSAPRVD